MTRRYARSPPLPSFRLRFRLVRADDLLASKFIRAVDVQVDWRGYARVMNSAVAVPPVSHPRRADLAWRRIALELQRLHLVTLTGPTGTAQHTTALTPAQREILTALRIDPPPRVTAITPA